MTINNTPQRQTFLQYAEDDMTRNPWARSAGHTGGARAAYNSQRAYWIKTLRTNGEHDAATQFEQDYPELYDHNGNPIPAQPANLEPSPTTTDEYGSVIEHDPVEHPSHYKRGGIEAIDVIEAFDLGFRLANTVKYILRAGYKDEVPPVQDLKKARWYLDREIAKQEAGEDF